MAVVKGAQLLGVKETKQRLRFASAKIVGAGTGGVASVAFDVLRRAKENVPVDRGQLRNSLTVNLSQKGDTFTILTNLEYASAVHEGSRPHTPPFEAIFDWAKRQLRGNIKAAKSLAGAVWTKIRREGTEAVPFLEDAFNDSEREFVPTVARSIRRATKGGGGGASKGLFDIEGDIKRNIRSQVGVRGGGISGLNINQKIRQFMDKFRPDKV